MQPLALYAGALLALTSLASAQSFNLDCGSAMGPPSMAYGAAGLPGSWNEVSFGASSQALLDIGGMPSSVTVTEFGAAQDFVFDNVSTSGDDGALMDDLIDGQTTVSFDGLTFGNYTVRTYAWAPDFAMYRTDVSVTNSLDGVQTCGGVWPGMHQHGVTYSEHTVAIDAGNPTLTIVTTVGSNFASLNAIQLEHSEFQSLGSAYCSTAPNSADPVGAILFADGSTSLSSNDLVLSAGPISSGEPGLFYFGPLQIQAAFGDGFRCVSGAAGTVVRLFPFSFADAGGTVTYAVNLNGPATATITAGSALNFQCWFRDPAAGLSGFNLSDARELTFAP